MASTGPQTGLRGSRQIRASQFLKDGTIVWQALGPQQTPAVAANHHDADGLCAYPCHSAHLELVPGCARW